MVGDRKRLHTTRAVGFRGSKKSMVRSRSYLRDKIVTRRRAKIEANREEWRAEKSTKMAFAGFLRLTWVSRRRIWKKMAPMLRVECKFMELILNLKITSSLLQHEGIYIMISKAYQLAIFAIVNPTITIGKLILGSNPLLIVGLVGYSKLELFFL